MNCGTCSRCGVDLSTTPYTMSYFNRDVICLACKEDERKAPGYKAACKVEADAVMAGDYDFPGVGLLPTDQAFLESKLEERRKAGRR